MPFVANRRCDIKLFDRMSCYGTGSHCYDDDTDYYNNDENYDVISDVRNGDVIQHLDDQDRGVMSVVELGGEELEDECLLEHSPGSCDHAHVKRWYFDREAGECKTFSYSGCSGNRNNFADLYECKRKCGHLIEDHGDEDLIHHGPRDDWNTNSHYSGRTGGFDSLSLVKDNLMTFK